MEMENGNVWIASMPLLEKHINYVCVKQNRRVRICMHTGHDIAIYRFFVNMQPFILNEAYNLCISNYKKVVDISAATLAAAAASLWCNV